MRSPNVLRLARRRHGQRITIFPWPSLLSNGFKRCVEPLGSFLTLDLLDFAGDLRGLAVR